jgi:hypothetical protein
MISRKSIISCLKDLEKDPKIYACWLEGAEEPVSLGLARNGLNIQI